MKNVLAERQVKDYFCSLEPLDAKKTLFALANLESNERLNDSCISHVSYIAEQFDGVILANYAKELANKLMEEYISRYPGVLMTKKDSKQYTEVYYLKLLNAVGVNGLDYILEVIRNGKAKINNPASNIVEARMLQALRWDEVREDVDKNSSDKYHHETGLKLLGFDETVPMLEKYSYIIANIYEQTTAASEQVKPQISSVRRMKLHFIQKAGVIEAFYNAVQPEIPAGYAESDFNGVTCVYNLASKGLLKDSEQVLAYYENRSKWENANALLSEEFSQEECKIISENKEKIQELIKATW